MPFNRPTLTELRQRNRSYIQSELQTDGSLLRFSNMGVISDVDAGMAHLHYGYLDYIALQSTPYFSTDEYLAGWAALKSVYRKPATAAMCQSVAFSGIAGAYIPGGTILNRDDGYQYRLDNELTLSSDGAAIGSITAILPNPAEDSTGGGEIGNADAGTILTLDVAISGVQSLATANDAISGGSNIETDSSFRTRMLLAYQNTPQGGNDTDYKSWALSVSGVTRAWVVRRLAGGGTVGIYIMCDGNGNGGFPIGTDGISQLEDWGAVKATGDQLRVADYIYPLETNTALIYVCSPIEKKINFIISGIPNASSETVTGINDAIDEVFFVEGKPGGKILWSSLLISISAVPGSAGFILEQPSNNIQMAMGELPVRGTVTYI
ncbi:baseplate J/gp47 family protein [Budviciaceae bacterium BWR-B9]|uniref:Baseplate J/gp47 family protein n=1 Tax=Limnobaculum allomyrinae TaxID=2791986 RepID=A0ABS1IW70_9GAMM|nr:MULTISPECIES: baseplate J/gp47 family protein [Limnobaculum]MBK5146006.1 baseplate J/gp47 family protein [Limnobaculum allomyrinae]MBV7694023.1 baseplate J/gp47 family protein [Limnobaculum sp. M2-1]